MAARRSLWPDGPVAVTAGLIRTRLPEQAVLPVIGRVDGPLAGWTYTFDAQTQQLAALTSLGTFTWETPAGSEAAVERSQPVHVTVRDGLVQVVWPDRWQLLPALTVDGGRFRTSTLKRSLMTYSEEATPFFMQRGRSERAGVVGALTADIVCHQQGSELVGVDPATGRDVWRRSFGGGAAEDFWR